MSKRPSIGFHFNVKKAADGSGYFMEGKFGENQSHTLSIADTKAAALEVGIAALKRAFEDLE